MIKVDFSLSKQGKTKRKFLSIMFKGLNTFKKFIKPTRINEKYFSNKFVYSKEVIEAKKNDEPIVALETTIVTHGMPYPDNYETAINVENIVRKKGAIPATIGIINGRIHVGFNEEEIKKFAEDAGGSMGAIKCSQRDICGIVAGGKNGGTTVGGTVTIAHLAGISVMATGGIGGVHRGAEKTFDISSDLVVLGKTPVAVVCAGVKAILDIPKTLEFLETLGVPVVTIGETDKFPAFYSRHTFDNIKSPMRLPGFIEAAECIKAQRELGLNSGMIFAIPIPVAASLNPMEIEEFIKIAIAEFGENKINGKNVTPYLLKRITELSGGKSLEANKILIGNNAAGAAEISINLSKLLNKTNDSYVNEIKQGNKIHGSPVVIGGAVLDTVLQCEEPSIRFDGRTHKGRRRISYGGVGRNVTAALVALGVEDTRFVSVVGDDGAGRTIVNSLEWAGVTVETTEDKITARYTGLIDRNGECLFGLGEMDIFDSIDVSLIQKHRSMLENAKLLIIDGNPPVQTIREVIDVAVNCNIPAEIAYVKVVESLQRMRQRDFYNNYTTIYEETQDPAKLNRQLWDKLIANEVVGKKKLNEILEQFVHKQHEELVLQAAKRRRSNVAQRKTRKSPKKSPPKTEHDDHAETKSESGDSNATSFHDLPQDDRASMESSEFDDKSEKSEEFNSGDLKASLPTENSAPNFAVSTMIEPNPGTSNNVITFSRVNTERGDYKKIQVIDESLENSVETSSDSITDYFRNQPDITEVKTEDEDANVESSADEEEKVKRRERCLLM